MGHQIGCSITGIDIQGATHVFQDGGPDGMLEQFDLGVNGSDGSPKFLLIVLPEFGNDVRLAVQISFQVSPSR
ncbi:MAG: hypothetical protein WAM39_29305 [Bryobacteraceae bacterium]